MTNMNDKNIEIKSEKEIFNGMYNFFRAYKNKITNKLFGMVSIKCSGPKKGTVLVSYITGPFTLAPGEFFTDPHSNYFVAEEMAGQFLKRGYDVDVIDWNNYEFMPKKQYDVVIDIDKNLSRLAPVLEKNCKKIYFINGSYWKHQNDAEMLRLSQLEKRRGVKLQSHRGVSDTRNSEVADFIGGYGNKTVRDTFPGKEKIIPIPVPAMDTYDFPENKDFEKARSNFLWFGGGGAILKGLDLVVEAFASLPEFNLLIIGPSAYEKEFEKIYEKELALPNIRRYGRPKITECGEIMTDGVNIKDIFEKCASIVYMSASEGGGGAVVHAMQAGIFPIVSPNTGIDENAPSIVINDPTIEKIRESVINFSRLPPEKIKEMSKNVWSFAREHHTKEAFSNSFKQFIDLILVSK